MFTGHMLYLGQEKVHFHCVLLLHRHPTARSWVGAMTSILDSEAHFAKRAQEVGLSERGRETVSDAGYTTLGRLAFGVGQPGVPVPEQEFNRFATNLLGAMGSMQDISSVRRLLFEAQTLVMAQLREQVSNPEMQMTRKLPPVEREAKMKQLKARLPGVLLEHQLEPSHALLNTVAQMWETRQLQYIEINKLTSREHEVLYSKSSKQLHIDSDKLLVKEETKVPDQTASTELQVLEALKRRGVAFALVDTLSWNVHERYLQALFSHLRTEPPEGYVKTTLQQLLKADRQVFLTMIRQDVSVRRQEDDTLAMDSAIMAALQSYEVGFHLMPLPKPKATDAKAQQANTGSPSNQSSTWVPRGSQPYHKGQFKGKSKGKGKGKRQANILPAELQNKGCVGVDDHGRRLCFNFNLNKCQEAASGAECSRGWHLCMKKSCHAPHSFLDHDKGKKP